MPPFSSGSGGGFDFSGVGGFLGGVGSLAGGLAGLFGGGGVDYGAMASQNQFNQNLMNYQLQDAWAKMGEQERFQKEVAQNSILWRVADAKQAGVSPLVALGAPTFSAPISVGGASGEGASGPIYNERGNIGPSLQKMGVGLQDILAKSMTDDDKMNTTYRDMVRGQQLQSNELELQIKAAQLKLVQSRLLGPSAPNVNAGAVSTVPDKVISHELDRGDVTAGLHPDSARFQGQSGDYLSPTDPAVINNPSITNPFMIRWLWNQYVGAVDRNVTNPLRRMMGLPDYKRGN